MSQQEKPQQDADKDADKDADRDQVLSHRDGAIGWIVFSNPARLNAMTSEMAGQADDILRGFEDDPEIRVIILRGAGQRAFMSGGDISKFRETRFDPATAVASRANSDALKTRLLALEKPVIAMIHGYCLGGGLGLALCADMRFGDSDSKLGIPAALRGIAYAPAGLKMLLDLVGPSVARDLMYSGRRVVADEALRIGLLNRVFPPETLEQEVLAYARLLASNAPLSIRASKFCIAQLALEPGARDQDRIERVQAEAAESEDFKEATIAFMEKRKPVFRGR